MADVNPAVGGAYSNPTHPRPCGPMVAFYLARSIQGQAIPGNKDVVQTCKINGYPYEIKFGAENTVPREVYEVFQNSLSRTVIPDLTKAMRNPRQMSNPMDGSGYKTTEQVQDYEMHLIKEEK